jgi:YbbR domain-containing protein
MKFLKDANWGLKLLALVLAIVIYHAMKSDSGKNTNNNDRRLFQSH